jgi:predicted dithiol-disulfide oxidoreductase (DUF899 family)
MQVWFHFLYHFMLRRLSEKRPDYSCAWCNMYAGSLRGLVAHLVSSHDRFRFQATVRSHNCGFQLEVIPNLMTCL